MRIAAALNSNRIESACPAYIDYRVTVFAMKSLNPTGRAGKPIILPPITFKDAVKKMRSSIEQSRPIDPAIDMLIWSKARELLQWRCSWRRLAMVRCLFVRIGECEQMAFVPRAAKDRQARG